MVSPDYFVQALVSKQVLDENLTYSFFQLENWYSVGMGKRCGLKTLMVGSGVDTLETAKSLDESHSPDYFVQTLGDLLSA